MVIFGDLADLSRLHSRWHGGVAGVRPNLKPDWAILDRHSIALVGKQHVVIASLK